MALAHAQDAEDANASRRFWEATLPGGEYLVEVRAIQSISYHVYYVDSGVKVTEVVVDTGGRSLARFYTFSAPAPTADAQGVANGVRDVVNEAGEVAGVDTNFVVKNYPATTHAHTVEYRLTTEEQLMSLYESVKRSWRQGRGRKFQPE